MIHKCHAFKCAKEIPPKLFMCRKHWSMLPKNFQSDIWKHYRPGQEIDKRPTVEYVRAAQRAILMIVVADSGIPLNMAVNIFNKPKGGQMKISEVKYGRKFNLGNYESEDVALTAVVDEDDDVTEVIAELKQTVEDAHSGTASTAKTEPEDEDEDKDGSTDDDSETDDDSDSKNDDDGSEDEDDDKGSEGGEEKNDEDGESSDDAEDEDKPPKKSRSSTAGNKAGKAKTTKESKGKAGKTGGTKVKPKAEVYDRENGTHKDIFSNVLTEVVPGWKKDEKTKAKAKKVSASHEGEAFLDKNGEVVASFKQSVKKAMAKK